LQRWDSPKCKVCRVSRVRSSRAVLSREEQTRGEGRGKGGNGGVASASGKENASLRSPVL
jgi:hypothetical protein